MAAPEQTARIKSGFLPHVAALRPIAQAEARPPSERGEGAMRSDAALMAAIGEGEELALQALMDRHWARLIGYARGMLQDPDAAEDIAQEVFVRAWERRSRWTPGGSVPAYLHRIARNLILLRLRHQEVRTRTEPQVRALSRRGPTPLQTTAGRELLEAVEAALGKLPDRRREAFLLTRIQGMSLQEAGKVMDVTRRTVANHVYMATVELEELLRPFL